MFYYYEKDNKILASQRAVCPTPRESPSPAPPSITWWRATRYWAGVPSR